MTWTLDAIEFQACLPLPSGCNVMCGLDEDLSAEEFDKYGVCVEQLLGGLVHHVEDIRAHEPSLPPVCGKLLVLLDAHPCKWRTGHFSLILPTEAPEAYAVRLTWLWRNFCAPYMDTVPGDVDAAAVELGVAAGVSKFQVLSVAAVYGRFLGNLLPSCLFAWGSGLSEDELPTQQEVQTDEDDIATFAVPAEPFSTPHLPGTVDLRQFAEVGNKLRTEAPMHFPASDLMLKLVEVGYPRCFDVLLHLEREAGDLLTCSANHMLSVVICEPRAHNVTDPQWNEMCDLFVRMPAFQYRRRMAVLEEHYASVVDLLEVLSAHCTGVCHGHFATQSTHLAMALPTTDRKPLYVATVLHYPRLLGKLLPVVLPASDQTSHVQTFIHCYTTWPTYKDASIELFGNYCFPKLLLLPAPAYQQTISSGGTTQNFAADFAQWSGYVLMDLLRRNDSATAASVAAKELEIKQKDKLLDQMPKKKRQIAEDLQQIITSQEADIATMKKRLKDRAELKVITPTAREHVLRDWLKTTPAHVCRNSYTDWLKAACLTEGGYNFKQKNLEFTDALAAHGYVKGPKRHYKYGTLYILRG